MLFDYAFDNTTKATTPVPSTTSSLLIPPESPNNTEPLQDMAILALDKCQWLPANVRDVAQRFVNAKLLSPVMMTWVADEIVMVDIVMLPYLLRPLEIQLQQ